MSKSEENRNYINAYLDYLGKVQGYSENTVVSYSHDLGRLAGYLERHGMSVSEMTFEDARSFTLELYDLELKPASINRILSANRSFFHNLCENGVTAVQPFSRIGRAKQGQRIPTVLSVQETERLLTYPYSDYTSLMEITMFNVFYSTGCRLSEVMGMKTGDIDLNARRILVTGKGSKQRFVFLTHRAAGMLEEYLSARKELLKALRIENEDTVFLNKKGKHLPFSTVHVIFDKYRDRLGLTKKFTPHVFRHTFATHLLDNNSDIRVVQVLLGHESVGTTQVYTHVTGKKLESVYRNAHPHANGGNEEHPEQTGREKE